MSLIFAPLYLVRDNDGLYGASFRQALRAIGVRDRPTQPRSPWQNGHVERLIGSIRRECLHQHVIVNAAHLRAVLNAYAAYYNNDRTHLALAKNAPYPRAVEMGGRIFAEPVLGGCITAIDALQDTDFSEGTAADESPFILPYTLLLLFNASA